MYWMWKHSVHNSNYLRQKGSIQLPDVGALTLDEVEVLMIKKALEHHNNKIAKAASALVLHGVRYTAARRNIISLTMKLRTKYIYLLLLCTWLHWLLSYFIFKNSPLLFIACEAFNNCFNCYCMAVIYSTAAALKLL
jgi:hypothetical protein